VEFLAVQQGGTTAMSAAYSGQAFDYNHYRFAKLAFCISTI